MSNSQQKSTNQRSKRLGASTKDKKSLLLGSLVATFIASTPFIFNLYESVPDVKIWDTFLFTYESGWYESANVMAWTIMGKIIPLSLLIVWFFTNRHWWYHALLVPMIMYVYQIIEAFNDDIKFSEENNVLYLLPVMAIVIPSIYLIRARMFNKINDADKSLEELEEEFKVGGKGFWGKLSDYF
ncbi:hypothetical protein [Pontimicrobium sp. SW4]|uniref:Uncharacterized protein n=1 Tax=Pontimicrobium sp. SW4 TaxID=3153519 RepID=A0AAU7BVX2_9FLAO